MTTPRVRYFAYSSNMLTDRLRERVPSATAIGIAIITHAFSYGPLVLAGLVALWTGGYTFGDVLAGVSGKRSRVTKAKLAADPWPVAPDP